MIHVYKPDDQYVSGSWTFPPKKQFIFVPNCTKL